MSNLAWWNLAHWVWTTWVQDKRMFTFGWTNLLVTVILLWMQTMQCQFKSSNQQFCYELFYNLVFIRGVRYWKKKQEKNNLDILGDFFR